MKNKAPFLFSIFVPVVVFGLLQFSCDKKIGKNIIPPVANTPEQISECDTIKYNKHIKSIIVQSCAYVPACHTAGIEKGGIALDSLSDIKLNANGIKTSVFDKSATNVMPPSDANITLSTAQLKLLNCWLNNGMKN